MIIAAAVSPIAFILHSNTGNDILIMARIEGGFERK
jgi:hypothetical protein